MVALHLEAGSYFRYPVFEKRRSDTFVTNYQNAVSLLSGEGLT
jgi:hypothetical protein